MEPESGYSRYSVEVTNLLHRATQQEIHNLFTPKISGICSISYTPRSGKCTIELSSRANADAAVKVIGTIRELAFSPHGQSRTLKASLQAVLRERGPVAQIRTQFVTPAQIVMCNPRTPCSRE